MADGKSQKAFELFVGTVLVVSLVGIFYDTFKSQGKILRKRIALGRRKDEVVYERLGAAVSPAYMNLGVASVDEYGEKYNPSAAASPGAPDLRVGAPVRWGPYDDDMTSLGDAYGGAYSSVPVPAKVPSKEELKAGALGSVMPFVEQRVPTDLLRGQP